MIWGDKIDLPFTFLSPSEISGIFDVFYRVAWPATQRLAVLCCRPCYAIKDENRAYSLTCLAEQLYKFTRIICVAV